MLFLVLSDAVLTAHIDTHTYIYIYIYNILSVKKYLIFAYNAQKLKSDQF